MAGRSFKAFCTISTGVGQMYPRVSTISIPLSPRYAAQIQGFPPVQKWGKFSIIAGCLSGQGDRRFSYIVCSITRYSLRFRQMGHRDGQQYRESDGHRRHAGSADAADHIGAVLRHGIRRAGQTEVVGDGGAHDHAQDGHGGVAVALTGPGSAAAGGSLPAGWNPSPPGPCPGRTRGTGCGRWAGTVRTGCRIPGPDCQW